jgi:cytoskeleton protein RodZ
MSVGSQLRTTRLSRSVTPGEVTQATKIQPWVLEALEQDRLQELMSPIYVKGFLATYARFLRLDPKALIAQLPWPSHEPAQDAMPPAAALRPALRLALPPGVLRRLTQGLAVGAAVWGVVLLNPWRWLPQPRPVEGDSPAERGRWRAAASQRGAAPGEGGAGRAASEDLRAPRLASVAPLGDALSARAKAPELALIAQAPLELEVTAHRTTWIQVRADGKLLAQQRLARGATERWTAAQQFEVVVAQPSQVELTLNGQPISAFAIAHRGRLLISRRGVSALPEG